MSDKRKWKSRKSKEKEKSNKNEKQTERKMAKERMNKWTKKIERKKKNSIKREIQKYFYSFPNIEIINTFYWKKRKIRE